MITVLIAIALAFLVLYIFIGWTVMNELIDLYTAPSSDWTLEQRTDAVKGLGDGSNRVFWRALGQGIIWPYGMIMGFIERRRGHPEGESDS